MPSGPNEHLAAVVVRDTAGATNSTSRRVDGVGDVAAHRVLVDVRVAVGIGVVDVQLRAVGRERRARAVLVRCRATPSTVEHRLVDRARRRSTMRTRPPCSATYMPVVAARHASATGLCETGRDRRELDRARRRGPGAGAASSVAVTAWSSVVRRGRARRSSAASVAATSSLPSSCEPLHAASVDRPRRRSTTHDVAGVRNAAHRRQTTVGRRPRRTMPRR